LSLIWQKYKTMKSIVIIGQGQLGLQLTKRHLAVNHQILSVSRSPLGAQHTSHQHLVADLDALSDNISLPDKIDCLYYLAPPSDADMTDKRLKIFLTLLGHNQVAHIIYISTSGVYGDSGGQWLTETSPTNPTADRAKRRLNAEQQLKQFQHQSRTAVTILRCAAIYSDKTISQKRISANVRPVIKSNQAPYTNRIHLEDLTEVCWQAMSQPSVKLEIYNVSDGHPSTTTEHAWLLADLAGIKRNVEIDIAEADKFYSPAYMSYLKESKKLDITKLKQKLKPNFKFENCIDGIKDCLKNSQKITSEDKSN